MRQILAINNQNCIVNCVLNEDIDHLFVKCDFYGRILPLISSWLGFSTTSQGNLLDHLTHYGGLRGYSKNVPLALNIICLFVVWIIHKEINKRFFQHNEEYLQALSENVKLPSF